MTRHLFLQMHGSPLSSCCIIELSCSKLSAMLLLDDAPASVDAANVLEKLLIKQLALNRHLHLIEWVFEHKICVHVVYPAQDKLLTSNFAHLAKPV